MPAFIILSTLLKADIVTNVPIETNKSIFLWLIQPVCEGICVSTQVLLLLPVLWTCDKACHWTWG